MKVIFRRAVRHKNQKLRCSFDFVVPALSRKRENHHFSWSRTGRSLHRAQAPQSILPARLLKLSKVDRSVLSKVTIG